MINEVNKIIYNLLLSGKEVCLGGIGTLFTVRFSAQRTSRKSLTPPYRIVAFTEEQRGISLEEEIARTAGVDAIKAHEIFEHWLSEVLAAETLTIEGVGTLRHDTFTINEAFAKALNPQGRTPLRLKPKSSIGLYLFASVSILFALAITGYIYIDSQDISILDKWGSTNQIAQNTTVENNTTSLDATAYKAEAEVVVDSVAVEAPATAADSEAATPSNNNEVVSDATAQSDAVAPVRSSVPNEEVTHQTVPGTSYLVLGVFSTRENADRAIRQTQKRAADLQYAVYHYGDKFMVALYDAPTRGECQEFWRSLGDNFKDLWIYSRK